MAWLLLLVAGCFEVGMALGLKESQGFSRLLPSLVALGSGAISFFLLTMALRTLPAGTGYAVWTGIGAAGTVLVGILVFGEPATSGRLVAIALVLAGVLGLRFYE